MLWFGPVVYQLGHHRDVLMGANENPVYMLPSCLAERYYKMIDANPDRTGVVVMSWVVIILMYEVFAVLGLCWLLLGGIHFWTTIFVWIGHDICIDVLVFISIPIDEFVKAEGVGRGKVLPVFPIVPATLPGSASVRVATSPVGSFAPVPPPPPRQDQKNGKS